MEAVAFTDRHYVGKYIDDCGHYAKTLGFWQLSYVCGWSDIN